MNKERILPVIIQDIIRNATDTSKSETMRQFYYETLVDIRDATAATIEKLKKGKRS